MQIQKLNVIFRFVFIAILVVVCFSASSFMVLESSEFFEQFYQEADSKNFGFISALLNEVFLVIMAAVWVPAIQTGAKRRFHPANILIKGLVILLFVNTVGGASLNTVQKKLDSIQEQSNRIQVLRVLQSQIEDQEENISTFKGQQQKVNTVLATRKLDEIKEEIKQLQASQQSAVSLWLDIFFISLVRFTIQLANITAVWLASWLYRTIPINTLFFPSSKSQPVAKKVQRKKILPDFVKNTNLNSQNTSIQETSLAFKNTNKKEKFVPAHKPLVVEKDSIPNNITDVGDSQKNSFFLQDQKLVQENKEQVILEIQNNLSDLNDIGVLSQNLGIEPVQVVSLQQGSGEHFTFQQLQQFNAKIKKFKEQSL